MEPGPVGHEPIYPVMNVLIRGVPARLAIGVVEGKTPVVEIKDLTDAQKKMDGEDDFHHCPLCNEFMTWDVFAAHAPQCIQNHHAGRQHTFTPPGFSGNAVQSYKNGPIKVERF